MTIKEIQDLIKLMDKSSLTEFSYEAEGIKLKIKGQHHTHQAFVTSQLAHQPMMTTLPQAVVTPPQPVSTTTAPAADDSAKSLTTESPSSAGFIEIKSPMVGTFYRSSGPDKPVFVNVGDTISNGSVLCIIEAMKLFNEIESETSGKIVKIMVEDASPVEYDQVLFLVEA
jgi:acetyl-CoA carboxylase biotin carboxyl carrier protein